MANNTHKSDVKSVITSLLSVKDIGKKQSISVHIVDILFISGKKDKQLLSINVIETIALFTCPIKRN